MLLSVVLRCSMLPRVFKVTAVVYSKIIRQIAKKEEGAAFTTDLQDQAFVVEFSPYEWSKNLICIGFTAKISIASITFPEEREIGDELDADADRNGFSFKVLKEFHHEHRVQALAWGPDTSLKGLPRNISLASVGRDHKVRVFTSDLETSSQQVLAGHKDYVNALAFDPEGSMVASVSDDLTCQLWNVREFDPFGKSEITLWLSSPGMSVSWHASEPSKLLVGEKSGLLQVFDVSNQQPLLSIDAGTVPLMAAHWSPSNCNSVAALAGGELFVWDLVRPSRPLEVRPVHPQGGRWLRFCSGSELVVATLGRPGHQLKVCNIRAKLPMLQVSLPLASGLSWHQQLPYVCVTSGNRLCFWKVATK